MNEEEILERIGLINPLEEAHTSVRINLQLKAPLHLILAMEKKIKELGITGEQATAKYIFLCLFRTTFFEEGETDHILQTLASKFKFEKIEPEIKEVIDP